MRLLFLDVDGVLNKYGAGCNKIDPDKLVLVREICDATSCAVIISSEWRRNKSSRQVLSSLLSNADIWHMGYTPTLEVQTVEGGLWLCPSRCDEIKKYLETYPFCLGFAILDDMEDLGDLQSHLVKTDPKIGLTEEIAKKVIAKINEDYKQE